MKVCELWSDEGEEVWSDEGEEVWSDEGEEVWSDEGEEVWSDEAPLEHRAPLTPRAHTGGPSDPGTRPEGVQHTGGGGATDLLEQRPDLLVELLFTSQGWPTPACNSGGLHCGGLDREGLPCRGLDCGGLD
ncbi:unnamed protein product [Gadus morhua 'NCC']